MLPALVAALAPAAAAAVRDVWVAAVPIHWNAVPNAQDVIHGMRFDPADTTFPRVPRHRARTVVRVVTRLRRPG